MKHVTLDDFHVLHPPFAEEMARLLPLPGTVDFYALTGEGELQPLQAYLASERASIPAERSVPPPRLLDDQLVIPFSLSSGEQGAAMISEIDPAFLRKMSASWLRDVRDSFLERIEQVRWGYIHPETGLYNQRAATVHLQGTRGEQPCFFLLLNTVFYRRTAMGNLQKLHEIADLMVALTRCYCFSFGYGVFGLLLPVHRRKRALQTAHYLQHQLRREGMSKVPIGLTRVPPADEPQDELVLDRLWRSLAIAEQRGPFGICDIDTVDERHPHPFQLTPSDLAEELRHHWRGLSGFTLAILSRQTMTETAKDFAAHMQEVVNADGLFFDENDGPLAIILFPDHTGKSVVPCIDRVNRSCQERYGADAVSIGVASWPCLDFSKSDILGNCLKALYHGRFLGPGSLVFFDHLSLNISGDYFFDEGEYRAALREYRRGLRLQPGDINLANSMGVALVECKQERHAAACFLEVLQQDPDNYMALVNLGHVRQTLGQSQGALECFERAYQAHANSEGAGQELFLSLGRLYAECGQHDQALAVLTHWRAHPGSDKEFLLFRLLGLEYLEAGRPEEAIQACQRALHLFPQDSVSLSTLGLLYVEQGEGAEVGIALCNKALALDNFNPDHWYRLSRALLHIGRKTEALEAGKQCLRLRRNHVQGMLQLGLVQRAQGREKLARKWFLQALAAKGCHSTLAARARMYVSGVSESGQER
jgi:tetratricopeptide (TPR) repeat protein